MEKAIIGKKVGMTQIFDEAGKVIPVSRHSAGPCTVVRRRPRKRTAYHRPFSWDLRKSPSASSPSPNWATARSLARPCGC